MLFRFLGAAVRAWRADPRLCGPEEKRRLPRLLLVSVRLQHDFHSRRQVGKGAEGQGEPKETMKCGEKINL